MTEPYYILRGIGGSHAHGLAGPESDEDLVGVFAWPTSTFWSLTKPAESIVRHDPQDEAYHELTKFCALAAKSNPTVLETLHLDGYLEKEPGWGDRLIGIRTAFYSRDYVMNAYLGYAESQFRKMMSATDHDARSRSPKHATHMLRLLEQGRMLYETGELRARVQNPEQYRQWATWTTEQIQAEWIHQWGDFLAAESVLPDKPDFDTINEYIFEYRRNH